MGGACSTYGREERRLRILVVKPQGKRPLRKPRLRWANNIKIDLHEMGCGVID
jgi:hypothetical protein